LLGTKRLDYWLLLYYLANTKAAQASIIADCSNPCFLSIPAHNTNATESNSF
jgi:hypothetical protein